MERLAPYLLLLVGMGTAYLAIGGLVRLRPERPEFWLFGMGVRSRAGAGRYLWSPCCCCFLAIRRSVADRFNGCSISLNLAVTSSLNPRGNN